MRACRGQALVEFAVVLLPMLMMAVLVISFSLLLLLRELNITAANLICDMLAHKNTGNPSIEISLEVRYLGVPFKLYPSATIRVQDVAGGVSFETTPQNGRYVVNPISTKYGPVLCQATFGQGITRSFPFFSSFVERFDYVVVVIKLYGE